MTEKNEAFPILLKNGFLLESLRINGASLLVLKILI